MCPDGHIPEQREASARAKHAGNLARCRRDVEPMERFAHDEGVDRIVGERHGLGGPVEHDDIGKPRGELSAHLDGRFDGDQLADAT